MILRLLTVSLPFAFIGAAFGFQTPPPARPTPAYAAQCASCHGATMTGGSGPAILAYVRYHTDKEVTAILQGPQHRSLTLPAEQLKNVLADIRVLAGTNPAMATGGYTGSRASIGGGGGGGGARRPTPAPGGGVLVNTPRPIAELDTKAPALSEAAGKSLLTKMCTGCHSIEAATAVRANEEGWRQIVREMVSRGAPGTETEIQQVSRYLAEHFGDGEPGGSGQQPATGRPPQPAAPSAPAPRPAPAASSAPSTAARRVAVRPARQLLPARPPRSRSPTGGRSPGWSWPNPISMRPCWPATASTCWRGTATGTARRRSNPKQDWLSYDGSPAGNRYTSLDQVNTSTVQRLAPAWVFPLPNSPRLEVTPVVVDGIMYATGWNELFAIDATTGRQLWAY